MNRWIRATWLPTAVFAIPYLALAIWMRWAPGFLLPLAAAIETSLVWSWLVARRNRPGAGRGALVGMICLALPLMILTFVFLAWRQVPHPEEGLSAAIYFIVGMALFGGLLLSFPLGAALGALTVLLQRRFARDPERARLAA